MCLFVLESVGLVFDPRDRWANAGLILQHCPVNGRCSLKKKLNLLFSLVSADFFKIRADILQNTVRYEHKLI
jgi:hypothetical protein